MGWDGGVGDGGVGGLLLDMTVLFGMVRKKGGYHRVSPSETCAPRGDIWSRI